jgi:replicative DNA helicase
MIKTGIKELDSFWHKGLRGGGLIVLAARPLMGKTSFIMTLGKLISLNHKTLFLSIETSLKILKAKGICDSMQVDDSWELNTHLLMEKITQTKPEVVLIDYVQLFCGNLKSLIKELKNIAVDTNTCMIVTSQIRRELEYRPISEKRPILSDLIGKGGVIFNPENLSNIDDLTFFYRDHYYNKSSQPPYVIELIHYENDKKTDIVLNWNNINEISGF